MVSLNLETSGLDEVNETISKSSGFVIGSPTLGGHMPTQVIPVMQFSCASPATLQNLTVMQIGGTELEGAHKARQLLCEDHETIWVDNSLSLVFEGSVPVVI